MILPRIPLIPRRRILEEDAMQLEAYLGRRLAPMKPRPAFVADLKERLMQAAPVRNTSALALKYAALIITMLISSALILATGVRAVVTILGALGVLRSVRAQMQQKRTASMRPAL